MDNSSRNIVKFIAVITVAALLMMASRFYAESQKVAPPAEGLEQVATTGALPAAASDTADEAVLAPDADAQDQDNQVIEEDAELIMGEPSMNLEQGGTPSYAPPAPSGASSESQAPPESEAPPPQ